VVRVHRGPITKPLQFRRSRAPLCSYAFWAKLPEACLNEVPADLSVQGWIHGAPTAATHEPIWSCRSRRHWPVVACRVEVEAVERLTSSPPNVKSC
jgi:hypothetical protein